MNSLFASAGRTAANIVDGTVDLSKKTYVETGRAGASFAAGWKAQRRLNATKRRGVDPRYALACPF